MQLSPLQSRLAASLAASLLLLLIYFLLLSPNFALAAELTSIPDFVLEERTTELDLGLDVNAAEVLEGRSSQLDPGYEPEFAPFGRSIIGRAPAGVFALVNNVPTTMNLEPGTSSFFTFEGDQIFKSTMRRSEETRNEEHVALRQLLGSTSEGNEGEDGTGEGPELLRRQQPTKTVFLSANTCMQPQRIAPDATSMDPPQLSLFVSTSTKNTAPGPNQDMATEVIKVFTHGAVMYQVNATGPIFFGVSAPNISTDMFSGVYNFEIAASIDGWFHSYDEVSRDQLMWIDSDSRAAVLVTHNLTDNANEAKVKLMMQQPPPYVMFAENKNGSYIGGVRNSFCGLQNYAQIAAMKNGKFTNMVTTSMTTRGPGNLPKQQFYFSGLNSSSWYNGILAIPPKSALRRQADGSTGAGGGGRVFQPTDFQTKEGKSPGHVLHPGEAMVLIAHDR
jgi:calcium channel MID1